MFDRPFLYKHCIKQHNILEGCNTIRLGTLDYYRKEFEKGVFWGDKNEGKRTHKI